MSEHGLPNPYVGPRSFRETDARVFFGRERELNDLLRMVISERIVLLYSPSGAGKTSLLRAGLVPALRKEGFHVYPMIRVNRDVPATGEDRPRNRFIASTMLCLQEDGSGDEDRASVPAEEGNRSLAAMLDAMRKAQGSAEDAPKYDVLIFDQFEEVLTTDPASLAARKERYAFFEAVAEALYDQNRWAVFTIREDYLAGLDPFRRPIPTRLANHFRLDLLNLTGARKAISGPAWVVGNVEFEDAALTQLVGNLSLAATPAIASGAESPEGVPSDGIYVEPLHLQVVCDRLWDALQPEAGSRITADQIGPLADVDTALRDYYETEVQRIANDSPHADERDIRDWFEEKLILGEMGIRGQVPHEEGQSGGLDNRTIAMLVAAKLVNQETRLRNAWYELSHDRLVGPVRRSNASWYQEYLEEFQRAAKSWAGSGERPANLLGLRALLRARSLVKRKRIRLRQHERKFLRDSRSALWQRYSIPLVSILVVLSLLIGWLVAPGESEDEVLARDANAWALSALGMLPNDDAADLDHGLLLSAEAVGQLDRQGLSIGYDETASLFRGVSTQPYLIGPVRDDGPAGSMGQGAGVPPAPTGRAAVPLVATSADGSRVASWDPANPETISLTDVPAIAFFGGTKAPSRSVSAIPLSGTRPTALAFLPASGSEPALAVGTALGTIDIWQRDPRLQLAPGVTLDPGEDASCTSTLQCPGVTWLSTTPDGGLVAGYADGGVIVWSEDAVFGGEPAFNVVACPDVAPDRQTPCGQVSGAATIADGSLVVSYSGGLVGRIADPAADTRAERMSGLPQDADIVAISSTSGVNGDIVVVVRTGGRFQVATMGTGGVYRPFRDQLITTGVTDVVVGTGPSPVLFWGERDGQILMWPLGGTVENIAPANSVGIDVLELSADGRRLVSRSGDGVVQLWNTSGVAIPGHAVSWPLPAHDSCVVDVALDGVSLRSRAQTGGSVTEDLRQLPVPSTPVPLQPTEPSAGATPSLPNPFALPRAGATAAASPVAAAQPVVRGEAAPSTVTRCEDAYRLSPEQVEELPVDADRENDERLYGVASMDGHTRAAVYQDGDVVLYQQGSGNTWMHAGAITVAEGADITVIATSDDDARDGALLALARADGSIGLWGHDGRGWGPLGELVGHGAPVTALRFHPERHYLGSGDASGVVVVWNLEPSEWVEYACFRAGRGFTEEEIARDLGRESGDWKPICGD